MRAIKPFLSALCLLPWIGLTSAVGVAQTGADPALGKAAGNKIYAQQLIVQLMAANPDLLGIGLHAIPPHGTEYVIVAQMRDLIGKKSSADDLAIIAQDATRIYPEMLGDAPRMKALAPLRDSSGRIIGLAALSFKRGPNTDKLAIHVRLVAVLKELSAKIPDREALFSPIP